jgi:MAC/Perforin domain
VSIPHPNANAELSTVNTEEASKHLNKTFRNELQRALKTEGDHAKRLELERLFDKWGHALATELVLGGERREIIEEIDSSEETRQRAESQGPMEPKLSAALRGGDGSGGMSKSHAVIRTQISTQKVESYVGGDPKFHHEDRLETWKASTKDCKA